MAFPTTGIIDTFDRANGALGAPWITDPESAGYVTMNVIGNTAGPSAAFAANYWSASQFGPDCEVYATISTMPGSSFRLYARFQNPETSRAFSLNYCYEIECDNTSSYISKTVRSVRTTVLNLGTLFAVGDSIGLECIGNVITAYRKPAAGAWGSIGNIVDNDVRGPGYISLVENNSTTGRYNDFGGGTIFTTPTAVLPAASHAGHFGPF